MSERRRRRAVEPADLFRLKFLQDAQLSPDGQAIAYTVSHVNVEKEEEYVAIWLLSLKTREARQLTAGLARDTNPQWSPDGKQISFLSTRGDKPQIYLIPVDGGEARALTAMKQGVGGGPAWSPDGRQIAFTAGPERKPPDATKPYRVTRHIYRFDAVGYLDDVAQDIYVIPAGAGEPRQLTRDDSQNTMPVWSPDGREILYSAAMFPDSHRVYPALKVLNLQGEVRELVKDWGNVLSAAWTACGEVVFIGSPFGRPIGSQNHLWVIDGRGGEPECRTAGIAYQVGGGLQSDMPGGEPLPNILVAKDGRTAYVQVQEGGTVPVYRVALKGHESWAPVVAGKRSCVPLDLDDKHLLFAVSTHDSPRELFIAAKDGANERQLTRINADLVSEWDLPQAEDLSFSSSDGVQVEGWIMKPCTGEAPYPTILYIHGGPHSAFGHIFSLDFHMLAGAGYAVLFINQRGSTGYGDEFSTRIIGDWGALDYQDLMAGVDFAIARGIADPDRLGCCGLSGGGNLTCWIVGQTDRFKAAVPENPVTNWASMYGISDIGPWFVPAEMGGLPHEVPEVYRRCSPISYAHRCTTPTLLVQGEHDYRCPAEQAEQFYTVLKASGCVVEMLRLPSSFHSGSIEGAPIVRRAQNEALLEWMNRHILGIESGA
ncbi:MAG TPA: S9 family peptidase [Bacillota bacterium]|nr:S9 family peptidase [Bacillota bacterium]